MTASRGVDAEQHEPGFLPDGRPDPEYARQLGLVAAPRGRRSLAFTFDLVIWLAFASIGVFGTMPLWQDLRPDLASVTAVLANDSFTAAAIFYLISQGLLTVVAVVQLIMHGIRGVTFGKMVFKLRTVRVTTFAKPGFWRIVLRAVIMYFAAVVVPVLGAVLFLLSPIWDPQHRGRGWHDRFVGVWMLDVKNGLDPTDAKALRLARKAVGAVPIAGLATFPSLATRAGHAAEVDFVPSARSSSGVIAAHASPSVPLAPLEPWEAPMLGAPSGAADSPAVVAQPSAPSLPPVTPAPAPAATPADEACSAQTFAAVLRFDDGIRVPIHGAGLLGRNPDPRPGEEIAHVIPVADATLQISKTHASFGFDERGFWVSDRNSSNGTTVIPPAGEPVELTVGQRLYLTPGSAVQIGGRRFTVELASTAS